MEDWIQLVIILLVIGGSVLGPIVKKLIEVFTPKDEGSPTGSARPRDADPSPDQEMPLEPVRPPTPTARKVPRPLRQAVREEIPEAVPAPPRRRTTTAQQAPHREPRPTQPATPRTPPPPRRRTPAPRPTTRPTVATSSIENIEDPLGHLTSMFEQTGGADERSSKQRPGYVASKIEGAGERLHDSIDEHLGHVESEAYARRSQQPSHARIPGFGRATPQALRQAILLREILGPPLALRPPDDESR